MPLKTMIRTLNPRVAECARAIGAAGYTQKSTAVMLRMSRVSLTRVGWLHGDPDTGMPNIVYGRKNVPKTWVEAMTWIKRLPENLRAPARRIEEWVIAAPGGPLEMVLARYPVLDPDTASEWIVASLESGEAQMKLMTLAARLCKKAH